MVKDKGGKRTWQWAQLSPLRGLRARRFATVRHGIEALRDELTSADVGPVGADHLAGIDQEVRHLLLLLGNDGPGLLKLWESSGAEMDDLPPVEARLSRLSRGLEARRAILVGEKEVAGRSGRSRPGSAQPLQNAAPESPGTGKPPSSDGGEPGDDDSGKGEGAERFSPSEAALLAHLTEKFYASWQFKAIALALALAAALAGTGTLLLGGKELQLSAQLDDAYKRSAEALDTVSKAQTDSLKKQNDSLTREGDAFAKAVTDAKAEIAKQQAQFTETLQTETVNRVVERLQRQLDDKTSIFFREIDEAGNRAVTALPQRLAAATQGLTGVEADLQKDQTQLVALTSKLEPLGNKIDAAMTQLAHVSSAEQAAASAQAITEQHRNAAADAETAAKGKLSDVASVQDAIGAARVDAERHRDEADAARRTAEVSRDKAGDAQDAAVGKLTEIASLQQAVDQARTAAQAHRDEADAARKDAERFRDAARNAATDPAGEVGKLRTDLNLLRQTVTQLDERLDKIDALLHQPRSPAVPTPPPPPTPPNLTRERVCAVQDRLNRLGFRSGWFEGDIGNPTRESIRRFQTSIGAVADGELTSAQIERLIGTADPPNCSQYPDFHPTPPIRTSRLIRR